MKVQPNNFTALYKKAGNFKRTTQPLIGDSVSLKFQSEKKTKAWEELSFIKRLSHNIKKAKIQPLIPFSLFCLAMISGMFIFGGPPGMIAGAVCLPPVLIVSLEPIVKAALKIKK